MKLRYLLLAQQVIVEVFSYAPTAVNIIEGVSFEAAPNLNQDDQGVLEVPVRLCFLLNWEAESDEELNGSMHFGFRCKRPSTPEASAVSEAITEARSQIVEVAFNGNKRNNLRLFILNLAYTGDGLYLFEFYHPENVDLLYGTWELQVNKLSGPPTGTVVPL
jgi:hypothetical protein